MSTVAWFVPALIQGSGGHRTILQNAEHLRRLGFRTVIYLENDTSLRTREKPADAIIRLFGCQFDDVRIGWGNVEPCDMAFATIWYSAKVVRDLPFECKRLYFVQDWEACFNPVGDTYLLAENSYRYGLTPITIGNWLRHELNERFAVHAMSFDFCADTSVYRPLANVRRELAVCFICQPEKPRRGTVVGLEALGIVKHLMPEVRVYLYGSNARPQAWFDCEHLGLLDLHQCNALYNRSTVGFCISSSNPSRIPFEMMAAGLPVVELYRQNTLYDLPDDANLLCDQSPESLAEGLIAVLRNAQMRDEMSAAGIRFMADRPLGLGFRQFADAVRQIDAAPIGAQIPFQPAARLYNKPALTASRFVATAKAGNVGEVHSMLQPQPRRRSGLHSLLSKARRIGSR